MPKVPLRVFEALGFNVLHLVHGVLLHLSPHEFLLEEIQDHEVQTPKVISPRKIDIVVCIQTRKTYRSPEICLFSLSNRIFVTV